MSQKLEWGPRKFLSGQALGLCSGLTTKACDLNPPPSPSHCGFSGPRGGRRGRSRLQASSEGLTRGHSYTGRFPFNKVRLFSPKSPGDSVPRQNDSLAPKPRLALDTLSQDPSPHRAVEQLPWDSSCGCGLCGVSSHRNTTQERFHTEPSGLSPGAGSLVCWLPSRVQIPSTLHTSFISRLEPTPLEVSEKRGQSQMPKCGPLC